LFAVCSSWSLPNRLGGDWLVGYEMVGQPEVASTGLAPAGAEGFRGHSLVKREGNEARE
jgi:hypothetical protein